MFVRILMLAIWLSSPFAHAKESGGGKLGFWIPVRLNAFGGWQSAQNSFENDKKDFATSTLAFGADFNVPIPVIRTVIGLHGWFAGSGKTASHFVFGPYLGYMAKRSDTFVGVGVNAMRSDLTEEQAAPNIKADVEVSMGCGLLGHRFYFGDGLTMGLGLTGFWCKAATYHRDTVSAADVSDRAMVLAEASSYGGMAYLMLAWHSKRQVH